LIVVIAVVVLVVVPLMWAAFVRRRARLPASVRIVDPEGPPQIDAECAARSIQAAELTMPGDALERLWSLTSLEQLARTYWRFLSRITLGLIHVSYTKRERFVVLLARPLVLLAFDAPEYELDDVRGLVRWRIRSGLLVSRRGRDGRGCLQIDVRRMDSPGPGLARIHVEVAVLSFYPAIATAISRRVYTATQSTIHVIVTHAFLRSLATLDLAQSRVGRFAQPLTPSG
jgi:hypothetical protein